MKKWFTTKELAEFGLCGLPSKQNRIAELAKSQKWDSAIAKNGEPLARKRAGRGGGFEYHIDLLPNAARDDLRTRLGASKKPERPQNTNDWAWFDAQNQSVKDEAFRRLNAINEINDYRRQVTLTRAIELVSVSTKVSSQTLWNWWSLIEGISAKDHLVALAPRRIGGGKKAEIDPEIWQFFKSDYLRPSAATYAGCYGRLKDFAKVKGLELPHLKTLVRRFEKEVPREVVILNRSGPKEHAALTPAQTRSVAHLSAMQIVNIDGHKWDVFVKFPAKFGEKERIGRPISVVIQDIYSRKILAWRTGATEDVVLTRLAFADLFRNYGIPQECLLDNGRAFASKMITGGAKTRFRFKVKEEDPQGLLTALGVKTRWATPAHGQSKPIERAFRDLEEMISKHPICDGAYTGNHIDAKPHNYGTRAVDFEVFEHLIADGIAKHNAKLGRRTETANGDSFDAVFEASYSQNPVGQATKEQLRLALLGAEMVRTDPRNGEIVFAENRYHSRDLIEIAGEKVTVRFDPDNLKSAIFVYKMSGEFVCEAEYIPSRGFDDLEAAKADAKQVGAARKLARKLADAEELLHAKKLALLLEDSEAPSAPKPVSNVIRPIRMRGSAVAQKQEDISELFGAAISSLRADGANKPEFLRVLEGGRPSEDGA